MFDDNDIPKFYFTTEQETLFPLTLSRGKLETESSWFTCLCIQPCVAEREIS